MLISHRSKFIYTKTVKTAGTSVETYFEPYCMRPGEWTPAARDRDASESPRPAYESEAGIIGFRGPDSRGQKWFNHMPAARIREQIGDETWNRYFKFCAIRNPWDKAISAFEYFGRKHRLPQGLRGALFRWQTRGLSDEQRRFLSWLRMDGPPIDRDKFLIDGEVCMDGFIRFEHLQEDMRAICKRLGLPWDETILPAYKSGYRRAEASVARLFSPAASRLIEQRYAFEIEKFHYRIPGSE